MCLFFVAIIKHNVLMGQKITLKGLLAGLCLVLTTTGAIAQTTTVSKISAASNASNTAITTITHRRSIKITGTGFGTTTNTRVRFYTTSANETSNTAYVTAVPSAVSPTEIFVVVPRVIAAGSTSAQLSFRVVANGVFSQPFTYTYTPPATTNSTTAGITEIVTNWNAGNNQGYWRSSAPSDVANQQPDNFHSIMSFNYGGVRYSTGGETAVTSVLSTAGITAGSGTGTTYVQGNFRALPIRNLSGPTGPNSSAGGNPNLIALGKLADGNPNGWNATAPTVRGLSVKDVLIDGVRGLGIGSGVTNLPSTSIFEFEAQGIVNAAVLTDNVPDVLVSQIAVPSSNNSAESGFNAYSVYCFTDENGEIVGNPVQIALNNINAIGRYKVDFYNLNGAQLNNATLNQGTTVAPETRDIRMVGYKLSEFGITDGNRASVKKFVVMPSGTSDPAFMAYNRDSFSIPAPEITEQPQSAAVCPGAGATFNVTVAATSTGTETPTYQWERNGVAIQNGTTTWGSTVSGATTATLSISNISQQDYAVYRCVVTNTSGSAFSNAAYLNTVSVYTSPATETCINNAVTLQATTVGNNPQYKWFVNTTNSTTGGTEIANQNTASYAPPVNEAGTRYYYSQSFPANATCAVTTSAVIPVTVLGQTNAGTISGNQTICPGTEGTVMLMDYVGTIQWQQTTDASGTTGWVDIAGANASSYTNPAVFGTTYYRAVVTNGSCGSATSNVSSLTAGTAFMWTGNNSRDWNTASNWSCNEIPTDSVDVIIPSAPTNQPIVYNNGKAYARTLTLDGGSSLSVQTGATLSVVNDVAVLETATFTIEDNAALLQINNVNNNGNVTVKKNSWSLFRFDYTMWSSPVSGQNLLSFSPQTLTDRFYEYKYGLNSANQNFEGYFKVAPASTSFAPAKGYLIRMPDTNPAQGYSNVTTRIVHEGVFTGIPFNGDIQYPLSTQGNRYTAVGNPYPSPINISRFFTLNAGVLQNGSGLYLWRKKNNTDVTSYVIVTAASYTTNDAKNVNTGVPTPDYMYGGQEQAEFFMGNNNGNTWTLAQAQGFIVRTATGVANPQVTFNNTLRENAPTSGEQAFFKQAPGSTSRLWLNITGNSGLAQTSVAYMENGTLGLDYGLDARTFGDNGTALYTFADKEELAIQARPAFTETDVVALGYNAQTAGTYTISLDNKDGLFTKGQNVYLVDKVLNITTNLNDQAYSFVAESGKVNDRFDVVYKNTTLNVNNPDALNANSVVAFKDGNNITVNSGTALMNSVRIFDIHGRQLYYGDNINAVETQISGLTIQQQMIIVEVNTDKGTVSKKLIF